MLASILGAAAGLASSIFGGIRANKQAKRAEAELNNQREKNNDWYRRRYNEDATQTAEAQSMLRRAREEAARQLREARGVQTVMGGTNEAVAQAQEAGSRLISNTLGEIANKATARKDAIETQYRNADNSYAQQYMNLYNQRAANATAAANEGLKAGMGLVGAELGGYLQTGRGLFSNLFGSGMRTGGIKNIPGQDGPWEGVGF